MKTVNLESDENGDVYLPTGTQFLKENVRLIGAAQVDLEDLQTAALLDICFYLSIIATRPERS